MNPKRFHLLDMGDKIYGDCIVCELGEIRILIDGGHPGDEKSREGFRSIPEQLADILKSEGPLHFDLLVVTHCHSDHIGCLPSLVGDGVITADWALVADEDMGFGKSGGIDAMDAFSTDDRVVGLTRALLEETRAQLSDDELQEFIADVATLESRYRSMLKELKAADGSATKIIRYGDTSRSNLARLKQLQDTFAAAGMQILGPTKEHLKICADAISRATRRISRRVHDSVQTDAEISPVALYRQIGFTASDDFAPDMPGKGAALNDMSIVLLFDVDDERVLLAGDMQFALAEVSGLDTHMENLVSQVAQYAPFRLYKISHHASYNGLDDTVLGTLGDTRNLVMSGGIDPDHPSARVLNLLREHIDSLTWARTDRCGIITFDLGKPRRPFSLEKGALNDLSQPGDTGSGLSGNLPVTNVVSGRSGSASPSTGRLPSSGKEMIELHARIPDCNGRVTITVDIVRPDTVTAPPSPRLINPGPISNKPEGSDRPAFILPSDWKLAAGRTIPKLLFVTSAVALERKIGRSATAAILKAIRDADHQLYDGIADGESCTSAAPKVTAVLQRSPIVKGVVVLGGYDVVPARKLDVLDPALRARLSKPIEDADNFIVWSDGGWGDSDGDGIAELPVSRVPDAGSASFMVKCLGANQDANSFPQTFGLRNSARPFAQEVYRILAPGMNMHASIPVTPQGFPVWNPNKSAYLMLHGSWDDTTKFWGEDQTGVVEAFDLDHIPQSLTGVVFSGCCWGALIVDKPAARTPDNRTPNPLTPPESIALKFLESGAQAFLGCTGTHYSPTELPYNYFGRPLHESFWNHHMTGKFPSEALYLAKKDYLVNIPHRFNTPLARAIELKIARQFTCLGLGW